TRSVIGAPGPSAERTPLRPRRDPRPRATRAAGVRRRTARSASAMPMAMWTSRHLSKRRRARVGRIVFLATWRGMGHARPLTFAHSGRLLDEARDRRWSLATPPGWSLGLNSRARGTLMSHAWFRRLFIAAVMCGLVAANLAHSAPAPIPEGSKLVYNFNVLGYPAGQTYTGGCGNGHRIFVNREANKAQVLIQNGTSWDILDCNATADHQAVLQTSEPGLYDVYMRI